MDKFTRLYTRSGHSKNQTIRQWLQSASFSQAPGWSWYEPQAGSLFVESTRQLANSLHPILRPGLPQLELEQLNTNIDQPLRQKIAEQLALEELRLFWPDQSWHLVNDEQGGHRWFNWSSQASDEENETTIDTQQTREKILLRDRNSLNAFGLQQSHQVNALERTEYYTGNQLIAWTLENPTGSNQ